MKENNHRVWPIATAALMLSLIAMPQAEVQSLGVSGATGSVPVTRINGRNYVEVESLARLANGFLSYKGNQMTLTLGAAGSTAPSSVPQQEATHAPNAGFSRDFLRAGIEAMSEVREWHSALTTSIANGYPVTQESLAPFQARATTSMRLAQTAVSTDADRKLAQMAVNAYQKMKDLSDKYIANRSNMSYSAPDALKNDPADQSLIACGKALGAIVASGQITDDSACR